MNLRAFHYYIKCGGEEARDGRDFIIGTVKKSKLQNSGKEAERGKVVGHLTN